MFALRLACRRKCAVDLSRLSIHLLLTTRRKATEAATEASKSIRGLKSPVYGFSETKSTEKIEEETITINELEDYYPVYIGEVIKSRYQIVAKQGYGVGSTVWLCRDLIDNCHLTLKVCVRRTKQLSHELIVSEHLKKRNGSHHPGQKLVQVVSDSFEIDGPHGQHVCLLYEPLGMKLTELITHMPNGMIPMDELQKVTQFVLIALDHIHRRDVIHADICMNNVLQSIDDKSVFTHIEEDEFYRPVRCKKLHDRHIYYSRSPPVSTGPPILCDFGGARLDGTNQEGDIMFRAYKPPEVILDMKWDHKVDIWGLGLMVWRMFEGVHLFPPHESGILDEEQHLAEMVSLLGPPPAEFLLRSPNYFKFWDEKGIWKGVIPLTNWSLEEKEKRLSGKDHDLFLTFMRRILCWLPENRPAAADLVYDDFLMQAVLTSVAGIPRA